MMAWPSESVAAEGGADLQIRRCPFGHPHLLPKHLQRHRVARSFLNREILSGSDATQAAGLFERGEGGPFAGLERRDGVFGVRGYAFISSGSGPGP
jgi:hypothetical protein